MLCPIVLYGLPNLILLLFNLQPLLVVAHHDRLLIAIDIGFYSNSMMVYPHTVALLLFFHLFVILQLRMHFLGFDMVHLCEEIRPFLSIPNPFLGPFLLFRKFYQPGL
jgi:hypothetical protein